MISEWVSRQGCSEVLGFIMQLTWAAFHMPQRHGAAPDRAFLYLGFTLLSPLQVDWNQKYRHFDHDHVMITVPLPHSVARSLSTAASRWQGFLLSESGGSKEMEHVSGGMGTTAAIESKQYVCRDRGQSPDPFQALKHGELMANAIAQSCTSGSSPQKDIPRYPYIS